MRRGVGPLLLGLTLAGLCVGGCYWLANKLNRAIERLKEAEQRLHASTFVIEATHDFLQDNDYERWPSSWEELEPYAHGTWGWLEWPTEADRFAEYVIIDFDVALEDIDTANPATIDAIRLTPGPYFKGLQGDIKFLLGEIQAHRATEPEAIETDAGKAP